MTHVDVSESEFAQRVLEESRVRPVVVDFWAAWCGPCRVLGPVLEKLAAADGGRWLLAKVDTERNQQVAAEYRISSIPAVMAFRDGRVVDSFVGALPEWQVRAWLDRFVPGPADDAVAEGRALLGAGRTVEARSAFERALTLRADHGEALLELLRLAAKDGRADEVERLVEQLPVEDRERFSSEIAALLLALESARAGGLDGARARAAASPDDLGAQVTLGRALAADGAHREAFETLLAVVHRSPRKGAGEEARKAMLDVFEAAGSRSQLSDEFRSKLAQELYR